MIVKKVRGNIFEAPQKHIAFAVNTQGYNDSGFAGQVASFWTDLANTGGNQLGEILTHQHEGKTYYALVCHALEEGGWDNTPSVVKKCLNSINIPQDEEIAIVLMGSGMVGTLMGADVQAILNSMSQSKKKLVVYSL